MLAKALKTFNGKYGLIRAGQTFNCDPAYFAALLKNKLVVAAEGEDTPAPSSNRSIPAAPGKADTGKGNPGGQANKPGATVPPPGAGKALTSSSLRRDLASRGKPASKSVSGAKKSNKTRVVMEPGSLPPGG
jgi:hypothetical protein